mgnify:CR=1 FL=1
MRQDKNVLHEILNMQRRPPQGPSGRRKRISGREGHRSKVGLAFGGTGVVRTGRYDGSTAAKRRPSAAPSPGPAPTTTSARTITAPLMT